MKKSWELEELIEHFTIMPNEMALLGNKSGETRLGFMVLLKFFQQETRFPNLKSEVPRDMVDFIAKQLQLIGSPFTNYKNNSRTLTYHKTSIREFFGYREFKNEDADKLTEWLSKYVFFHDVDIEKLKEEGIARLRE